MTTTDTLPPMPDTPPPDTSPPPTAPAPRQLRRSRSDRFGAGVCGGLGEYFGVDPILFRVVFATAAFFGGSGVLAYLLAWAVIPEAGTAHAPVDGWVAKLRQHRVPVWVVAIALGLVLWVAAFSWWAPEPFVPVVAVVVLLVIVLNRRDLRGTGAPSAPPPSSPSPVNLQKDAAAAEQPAPGTGAPPWVGDLRGWVDEAKRASRERRRRSLPVRIGTLGGMAAVLVVLAAVDAVRGVPMVAYFWTVLGFVVAGLLVGLVLRRTPWSTAGLLPIALAGVVAFGGSHAALHDGVGQKSWSPSRVAGQYRLGLGQLTLDLTHLSRVDSTAATTRVTVGAGQARVVLPADANIEVRAHVHIGQISSGGTEDGLNTTRNGGVGATQVFPAPAEATGPRIVVDVHLADGQIVVDRR